MSDDRQTPESPGDDAPAQARATERPRVNARTRTSPWSVPSVAVVAALVAVVVATVWLFASADPDDDVATASDSAPTSAAPSPEPTPQASEAPADQPTQKKKPKARAKPEVPRAYVEVYNNSSVAGLADETASSAEGAGWTVVGIDNWYGNIPSDTVYYPAKLEDQAELLADDLGIDRTRSAVDPMKLDRLTVILTG